MTSRVPALLIHGGAGADPALGREELRQGIRDAVAAGWARLQEGGSAVDAVEAAVCAMEDNPRFNAGRGSVLTTDGTVEMDASIMEGDTLKNGAVACVTNMRHPITLARRILDTDRHSLYVGEGAMTRARALGIPFCDADELITDEQRKRLESVIGGTVGAVRSGSPRPHRRCHLHRRHDGKAPGPRGRFAAHRLRHLRREHVGRRVVHRRRRGLHPRRCWRGEPSTS